MVDRIYPTELQLNKANSADTEAPFLDLNLCILVCWLLQMFWSVLSFGLSSPIVELLVDHMLIITTILMDVVNRDLQP